MKIKIIYLFLGILIGLSFSLTILKIKTNPYISINYPDASKREKFIHFLDNKNILYSYTITHLKTHRIELHIENKNIARAVLQEFEKQEKNNSF